MKMPQQIGEAIQFFKTRDWSELLKEGEPVGEFYKYSGMLSTFLCDCNPYPPHYDGSSSITCAPHSSGGFGGLPEAHRNCICPKHQTHFADSMSRN